MTKTATVWLVYQLTDSALLLGIFGSTSQIPSLFLALVEGVLVDRWYTHKTLVNTQILAMRQSLVLAFLTLTAAFI